MNKTYQLLRDKLKWLANTKAEHVFLSLALTIGGIFVFAVPPIAVVDEENHFFRALEISKANFYTDNMGRPGVYGANLPENMVYFVYHHKGLALNLPVPDKAEIDELGNQDPDPSVLREVMYNGSAAYTPVGYLPQAFGMAISRLGGLSNESYVYLGRLFNLLAFVLLTYLAIRIIPFGKMALLVAALLPTTLYQAASLSMDSLSISATFLAIAATILLIERRKFASKKHITVFFVAFAIVMLTKYVYILLILPLLPYAILRAPKPNRKKLAILLSVLVLVPMSTLVLWNSRLSPDVLAPAVVVEAGAKQVSVTGQIKYIVQNPFSYAGSVIELFLFDPVSGDVIVKGLVGRYGWLGARHFASLPAVILAFALFGLAAFIDRQVRIDKRLLQLKQKERTGFSLLMLATGFLTAMASVTVLYITFTSVGSTQIMGVQGRYFIPIIPIILIGFVVSKAGIIQKIHVAKTRLLVYAGLSLNVIGAAITIFKLYH